MSRYDEDGDYDSSYPYQLYEANLARAFKGKRGRKFLTELRDALMALPAHRLIEGAMCTVGAEARSEKVSTWDREDFAEIVREHGEGVCAIGAFLWYQQVRRGVSPEDAFAALPTVFGVESGGLEQTAHMAHKTGVTWSLAWDVAYRNDETFCEITPEERWTKFLAWIDTQLAA